jgi:hypothetical protein
MGEFVSRGKIGHGQGSNIRDAVVGHLPIIAFVGRYQIRYTIASISSLLRAALYVYPFLGASIPL